MPKEIKMSEVNKFSAADERDDRISINFALLVSGFKKFWLLILILMTLGGGFMFARSHMSYIPMYETSVTFSVRMQDPGSAGIGISSYSFSYARATASQMSSTFPAIIESNILQDIVCADMELDFLPASLSASVVKGTNMFTITAKGYDPKLTYDVLLSVIENYPAVAQYVIGNTELVIINTPEIPTLPYNDYSYSSSMIKGAGAGLVLGVGIMLLYMLFRDTVRTRRDIRKKLNRHCVGTLPLVNFKKYKTEQDNSVLITSNKVSDGYREAFRAIRNSVMGSPDTGKVIMLAGTASGEGKTTVAVNLGISLARAGKSVIIVDADTKAPSVSKLLGLPDYTPDKDDKRPGEIIDSEELGVSVMNFNTKAFTLWELFNVDNMRELFGRLSEMYDYCIIDTPPAGLTSEPSVIAQAVDSIIMVIRQDKISVPRILEAMDSLNYTGGAKIMGCILNCVSEGLGEYGYGYKYSGYGYRYGKYGYGHKNSRRFGKSKNNNLPDTDDGLSENNE